MMKSFKELFVITKAPDEWKGKEISFMEHQLYHWRLFWHGVEAELEKISEFKVKIEYLNQLINEANEEEEFIKDMNYLSNTKKGDSLNRIIEVLERIKGGYSEHIDVEKSEIILSNEKTKYKAKHFIAAYELDCISTGLQQAKERHEPIK